MANPNELSATQVYGNNALVSPLTSATTVINNPASSGKIFKVNSILASCVNVDVTSQITLNIYSQDDLGGTAYPIADEIVIPYRATLILVDTSSSVYLKEDQSIGAISGGNSEVNIVASWEEIN